MATKAQSAIDDLRAGLLGLEAIVMQLPEHYDVTQVSATGTPGSETTVVRMTVIDPDRHRISYQIRHERNYVQPMPRRDARPFGIKEDYKYSDVLEPLR